MMNPPEACIHSFIVKIWLDEESPDSDKLCWHGSIIHVGDEKRHSFRYLDEIPAFITACFMELNMMLSSGQRQGGGTGGSGGTHTGQ